MTRTKIRGFLLGRKQCFRFRQDKNPSSAPGLKGHVLYSVEVWEWIT
jgi:hypothetical protein